MAKNNDVEKRLVGLEIGDKGTVKFNIGKMNAKQATLQLFITTMQIAQMQGLLDGSETELSEVVNKLSK